MNRNAFRAGVGEQIGVPIAEVMRDNAARLGCLALLHAQLRAGAHILPLPLARGLGATIGLHADEVRASAGMSGIRIGLAA